MKLLMEMWSGDGIWKNGIILALLLVTVPTSTMSSLRSLWFGKRASEDGVSRGESGGAAVERPSVEWV
jgi:hypothetical protein